MILAHSTNFQSKDTIRRDEWKKGTMESIGEQFQ